jgi:DNA polymerase III subunit epsilon
MPKDQLKNKAAPACNEVIILDFETTGLSSDYDRVIEVGALLVKNHKIIDEFVELMNPGVSLSSFITSLTGISNTMLKGKPKPERVMPQLIDFIKDKPIIAHNATFDKRFLMAELSRARLSIKNPFLCTMRLAKKLIPDAASYKLAEIAKHVGIRVNAKSSHRAIGDAKVTAKLWKHLHADVVQRTGIRSPSHKHFEDVMSKGINITK